MTPSAERTSETRGREAEVSQRASRPPTLSTSRPRNTSVVVVYSVLFYWCPWSPRSVVGQIDFMSQLPVFTKTESLSVYLRG